MSYYLCNDCGFPIRSDFDLSESKCPACGGDQVCGGRGCGSCSDSAELLLQGRWAEVRGFMRRIVGQDALLRPVFAVDGQ